MDSINGRWVVAIHIDSLLQIAACSMQHATAGVQHTRLRVAAGLDAMDDQQANVRLPSTAPVQLLGAVWLLGAVGCGRAEYRRGTRGTARSTRH